MKELESQKVCNFGELISGTRRTSWRKRKEKQDNVCVENCHHQEPKRSREGVHGKRYQQCLV